MHSSCLHASLPNPLPESEVLHQFLLDAPRLDLLLDNMPLQGAAPLAWHDKILALVTPRTAALTALEMCCQTALAPFFSGVRNNLVDCGPDVHLIDGGRQRVAIHVSTRQLTLEKPFKVVDFGCNGSGDASVLFAVTLSLKVDLVSRMCEESWSRSQVVERDWCFVELLEDDDELGLGVNAGAAEVGLAAARKRRLV
jgi:hypothetical protein